MGHYDIVEAACIEDRLAAALAVVEIDSNL